MTVPERIALARTPTPLVHLPRTSAHLDVEFWIKRDDMTGLELSGNKVRKLEFLLADAGAEGADHVITCGGEQSNHCRATAMAATTLGMGSTVLLRTLDPSSPPATTGNILLDRLAGAEIVWISHDQYRNRHALMAEHAARLSGQGRTPYVIPEGGSNAVGAWGYVTCAGELRREIAAMPPMPTTVIHACGSGGTSAGLALGSVMTDFAAIQTRVACINVCDDRDYFVDIIDRICGEFRDRYGEGGGADAGAIEIIDGYVGRGYARSQPAELEVLHDLARREAIVLDPVYSGKAFYGLTRELARDPERFGKRVVFVHTGGLFGLFPVADELAPLL